MVTLARSGGRTLLFSSGGVRRLAPLFALDLVVSLALIEPAMGRLQKFGDTLNAKQYLLIMPAGEAAYLLPAIRGLSVPKAGILGIFMLAAGLVPGVVRLRRKGLDGLSAVGSSLVVLGAGLLAAEYGTRGEWVLLRRIGVRYLAFAMVAVGSFLCFRNRRYLAALGALGFAWDLSSAFFWAAVTRDGPLVPPLRPGRGPRRPVLAGGSHRPERYRFLRLAGTKRVRPPRSLCRLEPC